MESSAELIFIKDQIHIQTTQELQYQAKEFKTEITLHF